MVKTPEEYFTDQRFDVSAPAQGGAMTAAEQAFIQKYVGSDCMEKLGIDPNAIADIDTAEALPDVPLQEILAKAPSVQMIFFEVVGQVYCIPIDAVHEVIRYVPPTILPMAPRYVAGVVNLRGHVTPLIAMDRLLCDVHVPSSQAGERFIVVCSRHGLQIGLVVEKIRNMFTINQEQLLWNVESQLGANTEYICGIIDFRNKVYGIVSIDMIVDYIIKN